MEKVTFYWDESKNLYEISLNDLPFKHPLHYLASFFIYDVDDGWRFFLDWFSETLEEDLRLTEVDQSKISHKNGIVFIYSNFYDGFNKIADDWYVECIAYKLPIKNFYAILLGYINIMQKDYYPRKITFTLDDAGIVTIKAEN